MHLQLPISYGIGFWKTNVLYHTVFLIFKSKVVGQIHRGFLLELELELEAFIFHCDLLNYIKEKLSVIQNL